jgi:hypothetical protein
MRDDIRPRVRALARPPSYPVRRAAATGLPLGERHWPRVFPPWAQKWRIDSQPNVLKAPVVRMRAVSIPGPTAA